MILHYNIEEDSLIGTLEEIEKLQNGQQESQEIEEPEVSGEEESQEAEAEAPVEQEKKKRGV